jgi:hypothetical protein
MFAVIQLFRAFESRKRAGAVPLVLPGESHEVAMERL